VPIDGIYAKTEEDHMEIVQSDFVALVQNFENNRSKVLTTLTTFFTTLTTVFAAVEEGFNKAEHYEALARKSHSEPAALGLSREDLPRFVMFGGAHRPLAQSSC
jgi:Mg2+ and Co2+ transporter CorA